VRTVTLSGWGGVCLGLVMTLGAPARAAVQPGREGFEYEAFRAYEHEVQTRVQVNGSRRQGARPLAVPDIFGAGSVLNAGNVVMKVTNNGVLGDPFTTSSDPSMQWPGASSIEYMAFLGLAVGAVNPFATDPNGVRRVSFLQEWRPPTLDP